MRICARGEVMPSPRKSPYHYSNLTYNTHCTLLLDYNKYLFHSKESLTRLFQKVFNVWLRNTRATVRQGTA